jgi:inner membrane protein
MLLFAHAGITLGTAAILSLIDDSRQAKSRASQKSCREAMSNFFTSLSSKIDLRFLFLGALLPDIIDKPLGHFLFPEALSNGRIITHTLLVFIIITAVALYIYGKSRKTFLLAMSFGVFMHLLLDQMWKSPRTLFWPLFGFSFDKVDISDWIPHMLHALVSNPSVYIPELVGALFLAWFAFDTIRRNQVVNLIKTGRL